MCIVDGCDNPRHANGYCVAHHHAWRTYGDPLMSRRVVRYDSAVEGCDRPHFRHGFCQSHARSLVRYGDPLKTVRPRDPSTCTADGCGEIIEAHGYCPLHFDRWRQWATRWSSA